VKVVRLPWSTAFQDPKCSISAARGFSEAGHAILVTVSVRRCPKELGGTAGASHPLHDRRPPTVVPRPS
jgi:hypothetical protein